MRTFWNSQLHKPCDKLMSAGVCQSTQIEQYGEPVGTDACDWLTCRAPAWLGVSRDYSRVAQTAEVQAITVVVVLKEVDTQWNNSQISESTE